MNAMDLTKHYQQLLHYDEWANREVVESIRKAGKPLPRSVQLLAHVISAEYLWLARLTGSKQPFPVWPEFSLEECVAHIPAISAGWQKYFEILPDVLEKSVAYKNSKGESWTNKVGDILTHVFMHSAYHRGQIAANMREQGYTPAYTDFIHVVRQGLVE
jgi:uncharacterized damage-inducible protein DinB